MKTPLRKHPRAALTVLLSLALAPCAHAEICFTAFNGTVHYQFATTTAALAAKGTQHFEGRIFGELASCAGLNEWPLLASTATNSQRIILAFRAMTLDVAQCGGVDYIVRLNRRSLSGPLQLHNDRLDFPNASTLVPAPCANPPSTAAGAAIETGNRDPQGNSAP